LAAVQLLATDPDAEMLVMPADHVIQPTAKFQQAVDQAACFLRDEPESLVLFGVEPHYPATGFGYIERGDRVVTESCPMYRVKSFHEKPNLLTASRFMASSQYYWNCGIFVWRAQTILDALKQFSPEIHKRLQRLQQAIADDRWQETLETEFPQMPSISIDYAVLEKAAGRVCVLEAPFEWDDVGSWHALPRLFSSDRDGNTFDGLCCAIETEGCIVRTSDKHLIATIGVKDLIVVHTPTATLVADKRDEGSLKKLITEMEKKGLTEYL
jgi:mannose-1-phosphate guanylyltransferase